MATNFQLEEEFFNLNPFNPNLPGGFNINPETNPGNIQPFSPPPSTAPAPAGPTGGEDPLAELIAAMGGIPSGTGSGERSKALQELFRQLSTKAQLSAFQERFPNFDPAKFGLSFGGEGGGSGGFNLGGGSGGFSAAKANYALQNVPLNLPEELQAALEETLGLLLEGQGIPPELLANAQNRITTASRTRERNRLLRRAEGFNTSGLFESGLKERGLRSIEQEESEALLNGLLALDLENFNKSLQARGMGVEGTLGLGNLGQLARNAAINESLGLGQLEIQRMALELQRAIEEAKLNLLLQSEFAGTGEGEEGGGPFELPTPGEALGEVPENFSFSPNFEEGFGARSLFVNPYWSFSGDMADLLQGLESGNRGFKFAF